MHCIPHIHSLSVVARPDLVVIVFSFRQRTIFQITIFHIHSPDGSDAPACCRPTYQQERAVDSKLHRARMIFDLFARKR